MIQTDTYHEAAASTVMKTLMLVYQHYEDKNITALSMLSLLRNQYVLFEDIKARWYWSGLNFPQYSLQRLFAWIIQC